MIYQLAEGVRVEEGEQGAALVSRRPLRMVRLTPPLFALLGKLPITHVDGLPASHITVLESLANKGFLDRRWEGFKDLPEPPGVSIVIPVKDRADDLRNCLESISRLDYPAEKVQVVVVDDGSRDATPEVARSFGVTLIHTGVSGGGPALARNLGVEAARGDILAFIDSDCTASRDWLKDLLPAFNDPRLAAVGGWVDGMHHGSALDRYEAVMSSLNLGRREMSGGRGGDTFYLPSCNLLMRKKAFNAAGGFNAELHVGEDVDLTWRLRDGGWKIKYLPRGVVRHAHRSVLWPFMKRRFDYGTSEGILHRMHPQRGKKMMMPPMLSALLLSLLVAVFTLNGVLAVLPGLLFVADLSLMNQRMKAVGMNFSQGDITRARMRAVGSLGYYLGYHLIRYYLLPVVALSLCFPAFGLFAAVVFFGVACVDYRVRRPDVSLIQFCFFYAMEQLAYGTGVMRGCLTIRSIASYALELKFAN